jgi:prophage regulatory protein
MLSRLVRLDEVKGQTGLSRSSIYFKIAEGSFPHAVPIGDRAVAWVQDEVQVWIRKQIEKRSPVAPPRQVAPYNAECSGPNDGLLRCSNVITRNN